MPHKQADLSLDAQQPHKSKGSWYVSINPGGPQTSQSSQNNKLQDQGDTLILKKNRVESNRGRHTVYASGFLMLKQELHLHTYVHIQS